MHTVKSVKFSHGSEQWGGGGQDNEVYSMQVTKTLKGCFLRCTTYFYIERDR